MWDDSLYQKLLILNQDCGSCLKTYCGMFFLDTVYNNLQAYACIVFTIVFSVLQIFPLNFGLCWSHSLASSRDRLEFSISFPIQCQTFKCDRCLSGLWSGTTVRWTSVPLLCTPNYLTTRDLWNNPDVVADFLKLDENWWKERSVGYNNNNKIFETQHLQFFNHTIRTQFPNQNPSKTQPLKNRA